MPVDRLRLFIVIVLAAVAVQACDEPLSTVVAATPPTSINQTQKSPDPPTIIKQVPQTPGPSSGSSQSNPEAQPEQPSGSKSLNVPAYLFKEGQQATQNNDKNTILESHDSSINSRVLLLINKARVASGLAQLSGDTFLDSLAWQHSQDMAKINVMSHDGFNSRAQTILNTLQAHCVGENVAMGYTSAESLIQGWLDSPGHRQNIMNPLFKRMGFGIAGVFATQVFSD